MSFDEYEHLLEDKPTTVQRLDNYVKGLPEKQQAMALALLMKLGAEKCSEVFTKEGYVVSVKTIREWKRLNGGI